VALLQEFLVRLEKAYDAYRVNGLRKARNRLKTYSSLLGNEVSIQAGQEIISGTATDIDSEGRLVVDVDGSSVAITAGEVTVLKR
jgi:biotin-(acetyl-CoA carboxylase) ligase